ALPAVVRAAVVVDLRARAARAGHTHVPVVVRGGAVLDPVLRDAGDLAPQRRCLGIVLVDRHPQPALVEPVATVGLRLGDQVPRVLDGAFLEVVAEREVARHLEERVVPGGLADLVDVAGTHALLHAGRARVRRRSLAQEVGLELHHACIDEQQVRVVQDTRRAGALAGSTCGEILQAAFSDLMCLHGFSCYGCCELGLGVSGVGRQTPARRQTSALGARRDAGRGFARAADAYLPARGRAWAGRTAIPVSRFTCSCNSCSRSDIPARTSAPNEPRAPASSRIASPTFEANPAGVT